MRKEYSYKKKSNIVSEACDSSYDKQKAINKLHDASQNLPIEDLTDKKDLKNWLDDKSQDY